MGRPSVGPQRRAQILDATIECISEFGIVATTLERIAEKAGMSRGHVRHFAGNRDTLISDACRRFYGLLPELEGGPDQIVPDVDASLDDVLEVLFGEDFTAPTDENAVVQAFVAESKSNTDVASVLDKAYSSTHERVFQVMVRDLPHLDREFVGQLAFDIVCLALGNVFLTDLGHSLIRGFNARAGADALLRAALESRPLETNI
ncbi:TetR/AcrR family transcriptional regulator [Galactobacter sp.]|uniref:TetR/AcrR family transcriptional regulator n=1 Tax=Galactobacter sp. TaxID=2676125 RepID=UPI0025C52DA5|nr:TetR/AcrR family transcriptional regulator [Galactobacter sp.]